MRIPPVLRVQETEGISIGGDEVHQHIGAHDGYVFFPKDAPAFFTVCQNYLNVFGNFLMEIIWGAGTVAVNGAAAFVGHADGGKERTGSLNGCKLQTGFLWKKKTFYS